MKSLRKEEALGMDGGLGLFLAMWLHLSEPCLNQQMTARFQRRL